MSRNAPDDWLAGLAATAAALPPGVAPSVADSGRERALLSPSTHGGDWRVAELPADLRDRRVELHPPVTAAATAAALAAGPDVVVLDLARQLAGGADTETREAIATALDALADSGPALVFGPRPLDRPAGGGQEALPAALADARDFLEQAAAPLQAARRSICLRLPRLASVAEAELWMEFASAAEAAGLAPAGQIRYTAAIETLPGVLACDDIVRALKERVVALTFDRHACLQSFIRCFPDAPQCLLPDRIDLSTAAHFLNSWGLVVVATAHRRGALAIGPCASYLPPGNDDEEQVLARLQADKERHARDGFDGSGVADPALCDLSRAAFDRLMPGQHALHRKRADLRITAADLLQLRQGKVTEQGVRRNIGIALAGLRAAAQARRSVDYRGRRETLASVEFAADQLWHWLHLDTGVLDDGRIVDRELVEALLDEIAGESGDAAGRLARHVHADELPPPLLATVPPA